MNTEANVNALAVIFALITPYIVAFVNRPQWTRTTKRVVMVLVAVVMGVLTALFRGDFDHWDWGNFLPYLVTFIGAVQLIYTGLEALAPTAKLLDKAEMTFSKVTPIEAAHQKAAVNNAAVQEFKENTGAIAA